MVRGAGYIYLGLCLGMALVGVVLLACQQRSRVQMLAIVAGPQLQFPAPPNYSQEPTVWPGRGGDKQQAELDDALHAYQMQRMRTRILDEETEQQQSQWDLMNEADYMDEAHARARQRVRLHLTPSAKKADAKQQMLMYGNVQLPEESFSFNKMSGAPQCEDGCAFQDKVFTVEGFDSLCLTHCGEIDGMLKDASMGQRMGIALAQKKQALPHHLPGGVTEMLSEDERKRLRRLQAHEAWNVGSASMRARSLEKNKYYQLRKERFDRGETENSRFPVDDPYPLDSSWGLQVDRSAR